mmetsp:Transcript_153/g.390  ORF Transcript_153/g.390 Transcript_153/m.390 type:complete len:318 (-) Transcript_153:5411-6364(-)
MKESPEYIESRVQTKCSVSRRLSRVESFSFALANEAVGEVVAAVSGPAVIIAVSGPSVVILVAASGIATAAVVVVVAVVVAAGLPIIAVLAGFVSPTIGFALVGQQALVIVVAVVFVVEIVIGSTNFVVQAVIVVVVVPLLLFSLLSLVEQIEGQAAERNEQQQEQQQEPHLVPSVVVLPSRGAALSVEPNVDGHIEAEALPLVAPIKRHDVVALESEIWGIGDPVSLDGGISGGWGGHYFQVHVVRVDDQHRCVDRNPAVQVLPVPDRGDGWSLRAKSGHVLVPDVQGKVADALASARPVDEDVVLLTGISHEPEF